MIQAENEMPAETWFFKIIVCLDDERDFSDVLNACKQQLEHSLSTFSISAALGQVDVDILVHSATNI